MNFQHQHKSCSSFIEISSFIHSPRWELLFALFHLLHMLLYKYSKHNFCKNRKLYRTRDRRRGDVGVRIIARCISRCEHGSFISSMKPQQQRRQYSLCAFHLTNEWWITRAMHGEKSAVSVVSNECFERILFQILFYQFSS